MKHKSGKTKIVRKNRTIKVVNAVQEAQLLFAKLYKDLELRLA